MADERARAAIELLKGMRDAAREVATAVDEWEKRGADEAEAIFLLGMAAGAARRWFDRAMKWHDERGS